MTLLAIAGPSTVGKDSTWVRVAETVGFVREVPYTTRERRSNEQEGRDYRYVQIPVFHEMIRSNGLTEWDHVLGHYYGTAGTLKARVEHGEHVVLQVLARMAVRLQRRSMANVRTVLLLSSDSRTLEARLRARGYGPSDIEQRLHHAIEEEAHAPLFDYVIPDADILSDVDVARRIADIVGE